MNWIKKTLIFALMIPLALKAEELSVEEALKDRSAGPGTPLKYSSGYFRLTSLSIDSAFTRAGFEFLNSRLLNDLFAQKVTGQFLQKNPILRGSGGEIGLTAISDDETRAGHFHFGYYKGHNGHLYASGFARNLRNYKDPVVVSIVNLEDTVSAYDNISVEGMELESWSEYYFMHETKNPFFKFFGIRFGLGASTDRSRMRGYKISTVLTTENGTPTTTNYYPGILPTGSAVRLQQMDYRQNDFYLIVGLSYRAPIGRKHELDASAESQLLGIGGGYYEYVEQLIPMGPAPTNNPINSLLYLSNLSASKSLSGPVASILQGLRFRLGYTFKPSETLGIRIMYGQTRRSYTMYTASIKTRDEDAAASLLLGDTEGFILKKIKSIGVSKVSLSDRRQEVSLEFQARY
jgi:hypothetical protein